HYKGTPPALTDLLSGETHLTVATLSAVHAHLANGRLRAIAVASENRTSLMSDVPTVSEAGLTGYRADLWYAIFAPKATPGAVVERLNHAIVAALNEPQVREGLRAQGYEITPSSAQALAELMHEDVKLYRALQKDGNVKVQ